MRIGMTGELRHRMMDTEYGIQNVIEHSIIQYSATFTVVYYSIPHNIILY